MGHHFVAFDFAKICRALYESEEKEKFEAPRLSCAKLGLSEVATSVSQRLQSQKVFEQLLT